MRRLCAGRKALVVAFATVLVTGCGSQQPLAPASNVPRYGEGLAKHSTFRVLYRFQQTSSEGRDPDGTLIDVKGLLYGTTYAGGGFGNSGTIFSLTTDGDEQNVYSFSSSSSVLGGDPVALEQARGTIYGVAYHGGHNRGGTLFRLNGKTITDLHQFGAPGDGVFPVSLLNVNGDFYGTTEDGGASSICCGTVFRVKTDGVEKVLYKFAQNPDGAYPEGSLVAVRGVLYGTTSSGGSYGQGTVFSITTLGAEHVIYAFSGGSDGAQPMSGLADIAGTLYGTTSAGGGSGCGGSGCGTVYSISPSGTENVLYRFLGGADGASPRAQLIAAHGALFGTTYEGGGSGCKGVGCGTLYTITPAGTERILHRFVSGVSGKFPLGGLVGDGGRLYGTASKGGREGTQGLGTVFSISP